MTPALTTRAALRILQVLSLAAAISWAPAPAVAQEQASETGDAGNGFLLGPIGVTPNVSWQSEYDDNVFRTAQPVSDIVSTFSASTGVRSRMRRVRVNGSAGADWVHFASLLSERGANFGTALRLDVQFNRFVPYVSTSFDNTRQRRNPEIDIRPRVEQSTVVVGGILRLGGKTSLDFSTGRGRVGYDSTAVADGVNLGEALDRGSDHYTVALRQEITPVSRIFVESEMQRDHFNESSFRNTDNLRFKAGFESDGRIRGRASAGMLIHKPRDPRIPESRGFVMSVGTSATIMDRLQIGIDAQRDLVPSYRPGIAYYDGYSFGASISYAVRRSLRLSAMAGRYYADYREGSRLPTLPIDPEDMELQTRYGTGISYRLGNSLSFDGTAAFTERTSMIALREFNGMTLRAGISHAF